MIPPFRSEPRKSVGQLSFLAAPPPWGTHKGATATVRWKRKPSPDSLQWSTSPEQLHQPEDRFERFRLSREGLPGLSRLS